jgi:murein DD-endopeptidase MepM/ murein hydrolase activator NlpD
MHAAWGQARARTHGYGNRTRRAIEDIYASDHASTRQSGRFRWLLSTCLAAAVGVLAILVVIAGSTDGREGGLDAPTGPLPLPAPRADGLRWAGPKTDRLLIPSGAMATKFVVLDAVRQRRGPRDYIMNKPYARVVARLAPVSKAQAQRVPALNPFKLYANTTPLDEAEQAEAGYQAAALKIVELLGGILPSEDGQEIGVDEVAELIARAQSAEVDASALRPGLAGDGGDGISAGDLLAEKSLRGVASDVPAPNTSILRKSVFEAESAADDLAGSEVRVHKVQRGETLPRILLRMGAEAWQVRAMLEASRSALPDGALTAGQEVHVTLVPSLVRQNRMDLVRLRVVGESQDLTFARNAAGEFVASTPDRRVAGAAPDDDDQPQAASLYVSLHHTAQSQDIPPDVILQILRIHAYETDFRQRLRAGDGYEHFFEVKEEDKGVEGSLGELLSTAVTAGGETRKFYRFRTPDGVVDYYDEQGNTSRKFLMRRPVRHEEVRLTSGFGVRRHPILLVPKMHTGVDWSCPVGTPIMAAGGGVIEDVGHKGEYGNYVRIRHPNGYKTAYGHMSRFAAGVSEGVKVRQGQIIGYVGQTGMASGPHVHFEVLVNNSYVDPMSIQVPRERQLAGKQLADFHKERARIDELMRRNPVSTKIATATGGVR